MFHADGETDMTKLTVAPHNFANGSKNAWVATFPSLSPCYKLGTTKVTTAFPTEKQDQSGRQISASDPLQRRGTLQETPVIFPLTYLYLTVQNICSGPKQGKHMST